MRSISRLFLNEIGFFLLLSLLFVFTPSQRVSTSVSRIESPAHPVALAATYPSLNFSTYLGGSFYDEGYGIAIACDDSCFVTGKTWSSDFPTLNAYDNTLSSEIDAFVSKFSTSGVLLWSTYLGGNSDDEGYDIAVTSDGSCFVTGYTFSSNFPTVNVYNSTYGGGYGDFFVAKFSANGLLLWSTYLGGSDWDVGYGIAVAIDGSCYVTGWTRSINFPTKDAYDNTYNGENLYGDAFVTKFATNGTLLWSTFLGGNGDDFGHEIAVTSDGSCYVTGSTSSSNFSTKNAYDSTYNGGDYDAFLAKFNAGGALLWSTFLGGSSLDAGYSIDVANNGSCYATGETLSRNFPTKNAYDNTFNGGFTDVFLAKFSTNCSLLWSTYLGGLMKDVGVGIAVANNGNCYVTGSTGSSDFPTKNAYDNTKTGYDDAFISKFYVNGSLLWSTFLGGNYWDESSSIAIANDGSCYVTGSTGSSDFPTLNVYQSMISNGVSAFVTKIIETLTPPNPISAFGFLGFVVVMPILVIVLRKRKK